MSLDSEHLVPQVVPPTETAKDAVPTPASEDAHPGIIPLDEGGERGLPGAPKIHEGSVDIPDAVHVIGGEPHAVHNRGRLSRMFDTPRKKATAAVAVVAVAAAGVGTVELLSGGHSKKNQTQSGKVVPGNDGNGGATLFPIIPDSQMPKASSEPSPVTNSQPNTPSSVPSVIESSPNAPLVKVSPKLLETYHPFIPETSSIDAGDASFSLLQNLRHYYVSGDERYLYASLVNSQTPQATFDSVRSEERQWQQALAQKDTPDKQAFIDKAFEVFRYVGADSMSDNGTLFTGNIETNEFDIKTGGMVDVVRHVAVSRTTDENGNTIFYLRNEGIISSTPIPQ